MINMMTGKTEFPLGVLLTNQSGQEFAGQLAWSPNGVEDSIVLKAVAEDIDYANPGASMYGHGMGGKVSLLDCVQCMTSRPGSAREPLTLMNAAFRYSTIGRNHVKLDDECFYGVRLVVEGLEKSIFDYCRPQAYGFIDRPNEPLLQALGQYPSYHKLKKIVPDEAYVSYFTGQRRVMEPVSTCVGEVSVILDSPPAGIPKGVYGALSGDISVVIEFGKDPIGLEAVFERVANVRRFLSWIMGYAPKWRDVRGYDAPLQPGVPVSGIESEMLLFSSLQGEDRYVPEDPYASQRGIIVGNEPEGLELLCDVMQRWLTRNSCSERYKANYLFSEGLPGRQSRIVEDRIVVSANMFDLLPGKDKPVSYSMPDSVRDVMREARRRLECELPTGDYRDEVLNSIGRVGKVSPLRRMVEHRWELVEKAWVGEPLDEMGKIIRACIQCRNFHTHGTEPSSASCDFLDRRTVEFLAQALEFIYGTSELVLCGWIPNRNTMWTPHPFGRFLEEYRRMVSRVRE